MSTASELARLQTDLALYEGARNKILGGAQDVTIGDVRIVRGGLPGIEAKIASIRFDIARLQDGVSHSYPEFIRR